MNCNPFDLHHFQSKLSAMVEQEMRLEQGSVATDRNLAEYGLDSIAALTIAGDLEDELGVELPPTLLWDYPSIDDLANYLVGIASGMLGDVA
ncbi:acyl carrier protein [Pseudomonas viridiflava]|uniref:acyl carrier protein n=1 Tax=Pseudomonas viridiflava TaxID=33069 RepID=UPI002EBCDA94|nr:acyl carrier protein [Pseudomonas viridiflava]